VRFPITILDRVLASDLCPRERRGCNRQKRGAGVSIVVYRARPATDFRATARASREPPYQLPDTNRMIGPTL
jgi:hypothetical protein